jgi:penicillin-binding protein 1A
MLRPVGWLFGFLLALAAVAVMVVMVALATAYPNLPDLNELLDYRPKLPLKVYSSDGILIGEFGEERRTLVPIAEIPQVMKNAVLAIEDSRFYQHGGVDYVGVARAALANLGKFKSQGASTITMQVARNVYLSSEKTYTRKIYEILLTFKLEHLLTKDQILEVYMNQIFLGNRAYGFAAASEAYFGKPLKNITIAEAAMLAGLPKAPSAFNPIVNPKRARARQLYIIERMEENRFITPAEAAAAKSEELRLRSGAGASALHAEYVAETVRQLLLAQYGPETYTRGLNVYTTLKSTDQAVAYQALRRGLTDYDKRHGYRGPEAYVELPAAGSDLDDAVDAALEDHPDNDNMLSAVVISADARKISAMRQNGETLEISSEGLRHVASALSERAGPNIRIRRGAVIRIQRNAKGAWEVTQQPELEGAFVALDPRTGAVRALVGGFDFAKNKFNHVTQAWRQPGSSFKPFIYSAALEKGLSPSTVVLDGPIVIDAATTGNQAWEPKNYDGRYDGPMSLRTALAKSKNMVSIRVIQSVTPPVAQEWATRFGFDPAKNPPYLTLALGAGAATPMQMATAYAVFANGGYRINPWLIEKITDHKGKAVAQFTPTPLDEANRAIPARNAFVMDSLLQEVTRSGTAARAKQALKRGDIYGKTGTTNDSMDSWFAGFHPTLVAVTWVGYDQPRSMGDRETGGTLSLPVWISYMEHALKGVPQVEYPVPEGVVQLGDWYFDEFAHGGGVRSLGLGGGEPKPTDESASSGGDGAATSTREQERRQILDIFRGSGNTQ